MAERGSGLPASTKRRENLGTFLIFLGSFIVCLLVALVAQSLMLDWRSWLPGAEGARTLIGGVKSAVYTFMSYVT
jgi:light-harvesting complex 1 beta chain